MELVKLLLIASLTTLIIGQLVRIPLFSQFGAITVTDVLVLATDVVFLFLAFLKKRLIVPVKIFFPSLLFILAAISSSFLSLNYFSPIQVSVSALFLIRFIIYLLIAIVVANTISQKKVGSWLNLLLVIGFLFMLVGFLQLIIIGDLSFLTVYGWDPHQRRIVSTFLDPNFSGWVFVLLLSLTIGLYYKTKARLYLPFLALVIVAVILTFSRSTYLAAATAALVIGILKSPKIIIATLLIFTFAFLSINETRERIIGAFTLDETAKARLESWSNALKITKEKPLFGVGFNNYRYAQVQRGFFTSDNPYGGHSGSGSDSSVLLVLATTGIFGLIFFLFLLLSIFQILKIKAKHNFLSLATLAAFLGLLVHSQFVNSLFFPQIMLLFWFILGLNLTHDS